MKGFINDQIISDRLLLMTIEYVTFEASEYIHTYTGLKFNFPTNGDVQNDLTVFAMNIKPYKDLPDFIRMGFEALYVLLLIYNIFIFVRKIKASRVKYDRWRRIEIDSLSEIERYQRH